MAEGGREGGGGEKVAVINLEKKTEVCCFLGKTIEKKQEEGPLSLFLPSVLSPQKKIFFPSRSQLQKNFFSLRIARWKKME